jgi:hypothetical protein
VQHDDVHRIVANGIARKKAFEDIKLFVSQWIVRFGIESHDILMGIDSRRDADRLCMSLSPTCHYSGPSSMVAD